jgi:hypothetical protein
MSKQVRNLWIAIGIWALVITATVVFYFELWNAFYFFTGYWIIGCGNALFSMAKRKSRFANCVYLEPGSPSIHFSKISLKKSTALSSPVCPSQKIACLRTAGLAWVLAILMSSGTDSSFDR